MIEILMPIVSALGVACGVLWAVHHHDPERASRRRLMRLLAADRAFYDPETTHICTWCGSKHQAALCPHCSHIKPSTH